MSGYISGSAFIFDDSIISNNLNIKFDTIESLYKNSAQDEGFPKIQFWKRFTPTTKKYALTSIFALKSAKLSPIRDKKERYAIVGTSPFAATKENVAYYKDYLDNNKESSRGNLFVYTLPTVPLGELSMLFSFVGPTLFFGFENKMIPNIFDHCSLMIDTYDIKGILLLIEDESAIASLIITQEENLSLTSKSFTLDSFKNHNREIKNVKDLSSILYET